LTIPSFEGDSFRQTTRRWAVYARAVRFTDVTPENIANVVSRVEEAGGPPEGVDSTGMKLIYDESQGTAIFIGFFESEEKMREAGQVLEAMDASDTPGTRASVDQGEVKIERDA
jgi:hypothetical protein